MNVEISDKELHNILHKFCSIIRGAFSIKLQSYAIRILGGRIIYTSIWIVVMKYDYLDL